MGEPRHYRLPVRAWQRRRSRGLGSLWRRRQNADRELDAVRAEFSDAAGQSRRSRATGCTRYSGTRASRRRGSSLRATGGCGAACASHRISRRGIDRCCTDRAGFHSDRIDGHSTGRCRRPAIADGARSGGDGPTDRGAQGQYRAAQGRPGTNGSTTGATDGSEFRGQDAAGEDFASQAFRHQACRSEPARQGDRRTFAATRRPDAQAAADVSARARLRAIPGRSPAANHRSTSDAAAAARPAVL